MSFFYPFSILNTLLGEEGAGLCAYRAFFFVSYAHVNLCHFFSSFWCQGLAATSVCGSSWTVLFTLSSEKLISFTAGFFFFFFFFFFLSGIVLALLWSFVEIKTFLQTGSDGALAY